jgi:arylsulfatase A-like enzyme
MSFPDPHHPWDPPESEVGRIDWREVPLPGGYPEGRAEREAILDGKPRHWRLWYDGTLVSNYEAPADWVPATLTADQVREVNARNAVECELIDEALGRVLSRIDERGWTDDLDVVFTTDHGELQGDFGLLFKGPYHVDALMRLPLIWRPAPVAPR